MLIQLKHKQRKLTTSVLLMFVGGWLMMFCQNCLAYMGDLYELDSPANDTSYPCHSSDSSRSASLAHPDETSTHCLGVCDCDDIDASFNNAKHDPGQKEKFQNSIDTDHTISVLVSKNKESKSTYRIATLPEQATLIPLQHFTVLLN